MSMQLRAWLYRGLWAIAVVGLCSGIVDAQSPRVLYTWSGTGDQRGWAGDFGDQNGIVYDNNIAGIFRFSEGVTHGGTSYSLADDANRLDDTPGAFGGLDLVGLEAIEFDLAMFNPGDGTAIPLSFYIQTTPNFSFINTLDVLVPSDNLFTTNTYTFDISGLTDQQKAHIRKVGIEVRSHTGRGLFRMSEIRSVGTPLDMRWIGTHEPGSIDNALNGARVNFDNAAVLGSTGNDQTGLSVANGALTWTDLGGGPGAAISYQNGTWPWAGNDFESRPHDNSNYNYAVFRVRATDLLGAVGQTVGVQGFLQTGLGYAYQTMGPDQTLDIDGEWHTLAFPLAGLSERIYTNNVSLNFHGHANDMKVEIEWMRYQTAAVPEPTSLATFGVAMVIAACRRRPV